MAIRVEISGFGRIGHYDGKLVMWYDNEWVYSCRVADLTKPMGSRL